MSIDVSGFQTELNLVASNTFPSGFSITQFGEGVDPFDIPSLKIGDGKMGLNGTLITNSVASAIPLTLNVIAQSEEDDNLQILLNANRVAFGKRGARDIITLTVIYSNGGFVTFNEGIITDGMPAASIGSDNRFKPQAYSFIFESYN